MSPTPTGIKFLGARDRGHRHVARMPMAFEDITAEWLTEALQYRYPGVHISEVVREDEKFGTSNSARLRLTFAGDPMGLPDTIYIKGGFNEPMRQRVWQAYILEARFFEDFGPDVPANIPTCFYTGYNEEARQGIILIEDLGLRGVRFGSNLKPVSVDTMALILEQQAQYHGKWLNAPTIRNYCSWGEPQRIFLRWLFGEKNWKRIQTRSYFPEVPDILPNHQFALTALERLWELNNEGPQTLVHGDCHGGNLFYEQDGRPGFLDWQCAFGGAPAHDMTWVITCALESDVRLANEEALIRHYVDVLRSVTPEAPDFNAMFLAHRRNIMHGMSSAVGNPYDQGGSELTDVSSMRVLRAARELDMLGALGLTKP